MDHSLKLLLKLVHGIDLPETLLDLCQLYRSFLHSYILGLITLIIYSMNKRIQVTINSHKLESLKREAERKGLSLSSLVRLKIIYADIKIGSDIIEKMKKH